MLHRLGDRRDTHTGALNQRWASAGHRCAGIMDPIGRFNMLLVPYLQRYLRSHFVLDAE